MFTVNIDENGFILSISHTKNDNVSLDLSQIDLRYLNAYKLVNGEVVLDEDKKDELIAEEENLERLEEIFELEENLSKTDYIITQAFEEIMSLDSSLTFISDFIKIIAKYRTQYKTQIANRKA